MEKTSFDYLWELLSPNPGFANVKDRCETYWNTLSLQKRRQIYWCLKKMKAEGEPIKEHPLYAIQDCNPRPTNWNGKPGINEMLKKEKMVIAFYDGRYGTFTKKEAELFEMENPRPLN